jgi:putative peptidoglycan lipid II flippase
VNPRSVTRAATGMGAAAAFSRAFGVVRVLAIGAILGTTYLGNTFQGSNQFSTVLFELLAAGALSAVLVPTFVEAFDRGDGEQARALAGGILGLALVVLGAVTVVGVVAAPWLARLLASEVDDPRVAAEQIALATTLLRFFIPQLLLYAVGAVATGVLHAQRVFVLPALAPIANTVIMVALLVWFRAVAGPDPGLVLSTGEVLLLAATGTLGVAAFVAVPVIGVHRLGFSLRPRWTPRDEGVRRLARLGTWATVQHAASAALLGAAIVVGGGVEGGVVAFQIGWLVFLGPYGVIAQPIQTAVLPELVGELTEGDTVAFGRTVDWSLQSTAALLLPVSAVFVALALPLANVLAFGAARKGQGIELIAAAIASLGLGLFSYGAYLLLARTFYALSDSRTPAFVSTVSAGIGVGAMVVTGSVADGVALVAGLGLAHTLAFSLAALTLGVLLHRRAEVRVASPRILLPFAYAVVAGAGAWGVLQAWSPASRLGNLLALVVLGGAVGGACLLAARLTGLLVPRPGERIGAPA